MPNDYIYTAKGTLTMKGVTKPAEVKFNYMGVEDKDFTDRGMGKLKVAGFEGKTTINRIDYGVGESGMVGDNVDINITLEITQPIK